MATKLSKAETRAFFDEYMSAWNYHDIAAILDHLTDDVVWSHPGLTESIHGKEAVKADLQATFEAFPDMHFPTEDTELFIGEDSSRAVGSWTWLGTMKGPMAPGYLPTGKQVRISGVCAYRFRDGRFAEHIIVFDALDLLQQLGLLPRETDLTFKVMMQAQNLARRGLELVPGRH